MPSFNFPSLGGLFSTLAQSDTSAPSYDDDRSPYSPYSFDFPTSQPLMSPLPTVSRPAAAPQRSILEELDDLAPKVPRPTPLSPTTTTTGTRRRKKTGLLGDTTDEDQPDDLASKIHTALQEPEDTLADLRSRIGSALGEEGPAFDPFAPKPTAYTPPKPTGPGAPSRAQLLQPKPQGPWQPGQELPGLSTRLDSLNQEFTKLKTDYDTHDKVVGPILKAHNKEVAAVNAEADRIDKDRATFERHYQIWTEAGRPDSLFNSLKKEEDELNARMTANKQRGEAATAKAPDLREQNTRATQLKTLSAAIDRTVGEARAAQGKGKAPTIEVGPEAVLKKWGYEPKPLNPGIVDTLKQSVFSAVQQYPELLKQGGLGRAGLQTIIKGVEALSGAVAAPIAAAGETLASQPLPGHKGEPDSFMGRLREHALNVAAGNGAANMPISVVKALVNPPSSATSKGMGWKGSLSLEKVRARTPNEMLALETARRGLDMVGRLVQDPVAIAAVGTPGAAGELLGAAFTAKGLQTAAEVASNPNATPEDVAEAVLNAALLVGPQALRHAPEIAKAAEVTAKTGARAAGTVAYPAAKAMREGILAMKLNLPTLARSLETSSKAGIHTPIAAVEMVQPLEALTVAPVGETVGEAIRTARAPEPPPFKTDIQATTNPQVVGGLRLRGFTDAEIAQLTPEQAQEIFVTDVRKGPPTVAVPPPPAEYAPARGISGYGRENLGSRPLPWTPPPSAPPTIARGPDAPAAVLQQLGTTGMPPEQAQQFVGRAQQTADSTGAPTAVVVGQLGPQVVPAADVSKLAEGAQVLGVIDPSPHAPVRNAMVEAGIPAPQAQQYLDRVQEMANRATAPMAVINGQLGLQFVPQATVPGLAQGTQVLGVVNPEPGAAPIAPPASRAAVSQATAAPAAEAPPMAPPVAPTAAAPVAPPVMPPAAAPAAPAEAVQAAPPIVPPEAPPTAPPVAPAPTTPLPPTAPVGAAPTPPTPTRISKEDFADAIRLGLAGEDAEEEAAAQPTTPAEPTAPATGQATAVYAGHNADGEPLYRVEGGDLHGTTVVADALHERGIAVPETPPAVAPEDRTFTVGDMVVYKGGLSGEVKAIEPDGRVRIQVEDQSGESSEHIVRPNQIMQDPLTEADHTRLAALLEKEDVDPESLSDAEATELEEFRQRLFDAMEATSDRPAHLPAVRDYELGEDAMDPDDVFADPEETVRLPNLDHEKEWEKRREDGYLISQEEARKRVDAWKAEAQRLGQDEDNSRKVVYSLFDRTGNWSQPFKDAGYLVRTYDIRTGQDLLEFFPTADILADKEAGLEVVGVLAAPPCPSFSSAGSRWWKTKHDQANQEHLEKTYGFRASKYFDTPLDYAITLVDLTREFVVLAAPTRFHVLENPVGRLNTSLELLPKPRLIFQPAHYGDPYTKKTQLWGDFNADLPTAPVYPTEGSKIAEKLRGDDVVEQLERSETPEGFAYAFFMANRFDVGAEVPAEEPVAPEAAEEAEPQPAVEQAAPAPVSRPAVSQPTPKAVKPAPATAYSMNETDIDRAVEQFKDHPVLGPAARFLDAFKEQVNAHSDGWAYWQPARKAASKLQTLLYGHLMAGMGAYPKLPAPTAEDVRATLPPIKSFMTKRGTEAGLTMPILELPQEKAAPRPAVSQPPKEKVHAPEVGKEPKSDQPKHPGDGGRWAPAETGGGRRAVERPATPEPEAKEVEVAEEPPWADSEEYATYRYLMRNKADARRWDPDEEYALLEGALAAIDEFPALVRTMPVADLRDHLAGIEMLREETGKYALDELKSDLKGYDTSTEVVDKLERRFDRELRRREGQQGLFEKPTAEEIAARAKHSDGRLVAQTGDRVYQEVPTVNGPSLFIRGDVYEGPNQEQRVLITDSTIGGATEVGKTQKVTSHWLVEGDPAVQPREAAAEPAEAPAPAPAVSQPAAPRPTKATKPAPEAPAAPQAPPLSPEAQELADKRAKNLAEREEIKKRLRAALNKVSSGIDPTITAIVAELIQNYIEAGILKFRDAVRQFREDVEASPKADRAFEYGWAVTQHLNAGKSLVDAMALATKEKATRLKVADALKEADTTPEETPDVTTNRPLAGSEEGESGAGGRRGGRATGTRGGTGAGPRAERPEPGPSTGTREPGPLPGPGGDSGLTPQLYIITEADAIGTGSKHVRVARNLAAIQVAKLLAVEERLPTPDEQKILVQYVGWGGLSRIFEPWKNIDEEDEAMASDRQVAESRYWEAQHKVLRDLLTREEYQRARNSTQNAHYTSPTVIRAMWDAVQRLGITRGSVLEPSAGIGHFVGLMPAALRNRLNWALVEKDALTAQIAQALYPAAYTQATGFEDATLPDNHFALMISNVPFGDIPITDKAFKGPSFIRRRIHNYFPAKSFDKGAPGSLHAFVTSHGALDAIDDTGQKVRQYLAGRADLLGAIRLPFTAFKGNAGTEVVTDMLFLRKRAEGQEPAHAGPWMQSVPVEGLKNKKGETFTHHVNEYFVAHPEMIMGQQTATGKMREANQYNVEPTGDLATQLQDAIQRLPKNAIDLNPKGQTLQAFQDALPAPGTRPFEFVLHENRIGQVLDGKVTPVELSDADEARLRAILPIRDAIRAVYDLLADPESSDVLVTAAQAKLEKLYDAFKDKFGYLSEDKNWKAFREDPDFPLLLSLEDYDTERETAKKTAIFRTKARLAEQAARTADTPELALQLMLGERGRIDLDRAGELLGVSPDDAAAQLAAKGLILETPSGWALPAQYLSGNVRVKLAEAEAAAKLDPRYAPAVEALKSVIPPDIPSFKINTRLGAPWVSADIVTQFIAHIVNSSPGALEWTITVNPYNAKWHIEGPPRAHVSQFATPDVGTKALLTAALNDTRPVVKRDVPNADGRGTHQEINPEATALARARREDLHRAFSEWLFNADPERRDWAVRTYNDRMNALVDPKVDGSYLTFPGMAQYWRNKIAPHQRDGVARALLFGNTLAAWVVGAGKTLWMHAVGMELRRMGLARKPLYVVPNHLIAQAPAEFLQHYPNAKLLVATPTDLEEENRKRFTARIAAGDWDGIIMPISTFGLLSMSVEAERAYHQELLDEIELAIIEEWAATGEDEGGRRGGRRESRTPPSVKQLENTRDKIQAALEKLADRKKDDMLTFEQLGVDALIIDEAHKFKNLYFHTRQQAAGIPQNTYVKRAMDMYLKARYINKQSNYRNVFFATGTPVSNSMAEIFVMQKLLQEQTLDQAGLNSFDAWLQQFGHITIKPELDSRGTGISNRTRLANFRNLPDLGQMFRQVADIKMADDLPAIKAARPPLETGSAEVIAVPATERQVQYLQELDHRAENLDPRARHLDNMAKIMMDGRMSALDQRLINREERDDPGSKINVMVSDAADILNKWKKQKGAILVFMDMGTPGSEEPDEMKEVWDPTVGERVKRPLTPEEKLRGFNLYEDFKQKLIAAKAIKPSEIAFIHDVKKLTPKKRDAALKTLFRKVREGEIRVLMGSSETMATGMNVQDRLVALLNADPTIKPSEMEQRMGRILRQGNRFATKGFSEYDPTFKARILNYVTQGVGNAFGLDAVMWQLNESKSTFIADFYKGRLDVRDAALDLDNAVVSAGLFKAVATGNMLVMDQAEAAAEVDRLRLIHTGWEDQVREARWSRGSAAQSLEFVGNELTKLKGLADAASEKGETVTATIGGEDLEGPKAIGEKLLETIQPLTSATESHPGKLPTYFTPVQLGTMRGLSLWLVADKELTEGEPVILVRHPDDPPSRYYGAKEGQYAQVRSGLFAPSIDKAAVGGKEWRNPQSVAQALANGTNGLRTGISDLEYRAQKWRERVANYDKVLASDFTQQAEYDKAVARLDDINRQLGIGDDQEVIEDEDEATSQSPEQAMAIEELSELFGEPPPPPRAPRGAASQPAAPRPLPEAAGLTKDRGRLNIRGLLSSIHDLLDPGAAAEGTKGTIRHIGAESFRELAQAHEALKEFGKRVGDLPKAKAIEYWDRAERGESTGNEEFDAGNALLRKVTDKFTKELVDLDRLKAESAREHYVGRFWSLEPEKATDFLRRAIGRRPVEGPKSFLKQRTWDYFVEGIRAIEDAKARIENDEAREGDEQLAKMRPATYNYVESQLAKITEMQRLIAIERELRMETDGGRAKKVMEALGQKPPKDENGDPWVHLGPAGDPAFIVYGPKKIKVKEAFDAKLMAGLHNFARSLGVQHIRKIALGANRWGYAVGKSHIVTKVGGPEGILMHEIGHVLDERYGLVDKWVRPARARDKKTRATDRKIKQELRALADMREEGTDPRHISPARRRYLRKGSEKIANMVHAFIYMPERMKEVAPNAYWALHNLAKDTPELNQLLDLQKHGRSLKLAINVAEQEIPGFPIIGHWYAPKSAANVWKAHLSTGIRGNPWVEAYLTVANGSVQVLLGFSGFHFTTIAREAINSRLALGIDEVMNRGKAPTWGGKFAKGGRAITQFVRAVPAMLPITHRALPDAIDAAFGKRIMQEYRTPGTHPHLATVLDAMLKGGFRGTAESEFWTGKEIERLKKSWYDAWRAEGAKRGVAISRIPFDAVFAGIETMMKPLMGYYVPYLKTAAAYRATAQQLQKLPATASMDDIHKVMGDVVKEMDYRYGQVVYDNHFVNRTTKDIAQILFLAPGWTFGTLSLAGRGLKQGLKIPVRAARVMAGGGKGPIPRALDRVLGKTPGPLPDEIVGSSAAYWIGGVAFLMLLNGILTYFHTGDMPNGKDYFAYRDGTTDDDGNPNRHILPGYEMRDIHGWWTHPVQTFLNKLKPLLAFFSRWATNRTFFGDMVYNPDADALTYAEQVGIEAMKQLGTPLSLQNYLEGQRRSGGTGELIRNALGITPAKREFERTPAQNKVAEYLSRKGGTARTPEEVEEGDERRKLREAIKKGDIATQQKIESSGQLSKRQISNAEKAANQTFLERGFQQLGIEQALTVYELATPAERVLIWSALSKKDRRLGQQGTPEERARIEERFRKAMTLPQEGASVH